MNGYWKHETKAGTALIIWRPKLAPNGWRAELDGEDIGGYTSPEQALDDFTGGHTFASSNCTDTSTLGLPDELADWEFIRSR